ncbi:hypothetical protein XENOCAPTIV_002640 [Xenoophorus captivus]|uniref:Uncharacterized protein n=1 Tax=Xenoophorus captivus TaxID=1517983 RepID=A0ABV0RU34_9TELE
MHAAAEGYERVNYTKRTYLWAHERPGAHFHVSISTFSYNLSLHSCVSRTNRHTHAHRRTHTHTRTLASFQEVCWGCMAIEYTVDSLTHKQNAGSSPGRLLILY